MNRVTGSLALAAVLAGAAQAQPPPAPQMEVLSVFAPGNGGNLLQSGARPASFDSQVHMYRDLPAQLHELTDAGLTRYFKPALFEVAPGDVASVETPRAGVQIVRDRTHNVPHVQADSREAAMFGIGYARAEDRLWQMEEFRATWRAGSAALFGRGEHDEHLIEDAQNFRVIDYSETEYRRMFAALSRDYGEWGRQASRDITAYVAGLNACIAHMRNHPGQLPVEYRHRHLTPGHWSVTDVMAMAAYTHVGWSGVLQIDPDANSRLMRQLQQRFGVAAAAVFNDLQLLPDAATPVSLPGVSAAVAGAVPDPGASAILDLGSFVPRQVSLSDAGVPLAPAGHVGRRRLRSNALLVAASHSAAGHPIGIQGPQDGYGTPHIFDSEIAVSAPDFRARGVLEISGPYPYVASHGDDYGWSITILAPNQSDLYAEKLCEPDGSAPHPDSAHYLYRGQCIPFTNRAEHRDIRGVAGGFTLLSQRSVHGPVLGRARVDGVPVAVALARAMYQHEEMDYPAHARLFSPSAIRSARDFIDTVADTAYNIGWWYIDRHDIGFVDAGRVPQRNPAAATQFPVWGTGEWDWRGFEPRHYTFQVLPKAQHPQAINPPGGVLTGWNNLSQLGWPVPGFYFGWGEQRVRLLQDPTVTAATQHTLTITDLVRIHTLAAITDVRVRLYYPMLRRYLGTLPDPGVEALLRAADAWVADGALREDPAGRGYLEHSAAVAFLDSAWDPLIRRVFEPVLGATIFEEAHARNNLPSPHTTPVYQNGWLDYLVRDVAAGGSGGTRMSRRYCGQDDASCRALIIAGLRDGVSAARQRYGIDWRQWHVPTLCDTCEQVSFPPTGDAPGVNPIPWQNRGTYVQVTTGRLR